VQRADLRIAKHDSRSGIAPDDQRVDVNRTFFPVGRASDASKNEPVQNASARLAQCTPVAWPPAGVGSVNT